MSCRGSEVIFLLFLFQIFWGVVKSEERLDSEDYALTDLIATPRLYLQSGNVTINFLPFIFYSILAFILGILFKDPLVKHMEEYVDSSSYSEAKFTNNYNFPANDFGEPYYARPYPSIVIKDPLFKQMEETVENYNYPEYSSAGHTYYLGDPTRLYHTNEINDNDYGNINYAGGISGGGANFNYANDNNNYANQPERSREQYQYTGHSYGDGGTSDFETMAALMDITMTHLGDASMGVVKGILDYLEPANDYNYHQNSQSSPEFDIISNQVPNERLETLKKGNFLRSISLTPNTIDTYGMSTPNPIVSTPSSYVSTPSPHISTPGPHISTPGPYISTPGPQFSTPGPPYNPTPNPQIQFTTPTLAAPAIQYSTTPTTYNNNQNNNFVNTQTGPPIGGGGLHNHNVFYSGTPSTTPAPHRPMVGSNNPSLFFDPDSSTLFVDSSLAKTLNLNDGTTVELPTNVLLDSINKGQVKLLNNNRRNDNTNNNPDDQAYGSSLEHQEILPWNPVVVNAQLNHDKVSSKHSNIKDLLHHKSQNGDFKTSPKDGDEWSSGGITWQQINEPSTFPSSTTGTHVVGSSFQVVKKKK